MTVHSAKRRWLTLLTYPLAGLMFGLADPALGQVAQALGTKPGLASAAIVNLLLPLVAVALAMAFPRLGSVWLGAVTMTVGLVLGLAIQYGPPAGGWKPVLLLRAVPPVVVGALVGYAVLGTIAALVVRSRQAGALPAE